MRKEVQLTVFSALVVVITLVSLLYPFVYRPEYLTKTRDGTPFFTPPVINPDTGEGIELDALIRHYKGD